VKFYGAWKKGHPPIQQDLVVKKKRRGTY